MTDETQVDRADLDALLYVQVDDRAKQLAELREATAARRQWERREKWLKAQVLDGIDAECALVVQGEPVARVRRISTGERVDSEQLKRQYLAAYQACLRESSYLRIDYL